jgi:hypothetical protein
MYSEVAGLCAIVLGVYVMTHPLSIRSYSSPKHWAESPREAKEKQRSYATAIGSAIIMGGAVLIGLGLFGQLP